METGNQFVHLVRQMRQAQNNFFKGDGSQRKKLLNKSKKLEEQVDEYLAAYARKDSQELTNGR
tara:strand:- start:81 stop:269 length:189 start_codon:yes stop_codon:yes gene_type:complete